MGPLDLCQLVSCQKSKRTHKTAQPQKALGYGGRGIHWFCLTPKLNPNPVPPSSCSMVQTLHYFTHAVLRILFLAHLWHLEMLLQLKLQMGLWSESLTFCSLNISLSLSSPCTDLIWPQFIAYLYFLAQRRVRYKFLNNKISLEWMGILL